LNKYFNSTETKYFSSVLFNARGTRDFRNNPFMPTGGHLITGELELPIFDPILPISLSGLSKYTRLLVTGLYFDKISKSEVLAYKLKFGGVYFWEEGNRYISLDKQFFSGGANSVRGWPSRKLRYTTNNIQDLDATSRRLIENFVGNSFVLEGSWEYRLNFGMPEVNLGALSEHIASMGFTTFFDFGNSYGWLLAEDDYNISDIFTKLACSIGSGLTYETPVGPIRLDIALPIYGPINYEYNAIWNTNDALSNINWHIGLGYSF
jgi:outer membrane protein assembly factor BamA